MEGKKAAQMTKMHPGGWLTFSTNVNRVFRVKLKLPECLITRKVGAPARKKLKLCFIGFELFLLWSI